MAEVSKLGPLKQDVRVFQSSIDGSSVSTTAFNQPSFYMGLVNMIIVYLTQRFPDEFLAPRYMKMTYNGVRASAMLTIPFCCISGAYFCVASIINKSPTPLAGHLLGYTVSLGIGLTMLTLRRVSWYYPLLGTMYLTYGGLHHYRRMMVYGDNSPIYNWGDATEIWKSRSAAKEQRLEERRRLSQHEGS
ncbi:hypothetical protein TRVL_03045 [Trypanosoma vivax]|nr:hypothetical protein TRVL_03045 [Trypanosoma vivax]